MGLHGRQTEHLETGQRASVDQQLLWGATTFGAHCGRLSPDQFGAATPKPPPAFQTGIRGIPFVVAIPSLQREDAEPVAHDKTIDFDRPTQWARGGGLDDRFDRDCQAQILNSAL